MKRFLCFLLCGLLLLTVGCAAKTPQDDPAVSAISPNGAAGALTLTPLTGFIGPGEFTETETGVYEIRQCPDSTTKVAYIDYATGQETWLCSRPNCDHTDESCTAWFAASTATIFSGNGKLYVSALLTNPDGESIECLYQIEPDGSGRKELIRFPAGGYMQNMVVTDGQALYFCVSKWDDAVGRQDWLCKLDTVTGQLDDIRQMGNGDAFSATEWVLGAYDSKLVMSAYSGVDDMEFVYYTLDMTSGEKQEFFRRVQDDHGQGNSIGYPYGRCFYYVAQQDGGVADFHRLDMDTLEDTALCDPVLYFDPERAMMGGFVAGQAIYWCTEIVDAQQGIIQSHNYYIDLETGEVHEPALFDSEGDPDGRPQPINILAAWQDEYLVKVGNDEVFDIFIDAPGGGYTVTVSWPVYAFISKEDYFAGNPNYRYVDTSLME